MYFIISRGHEYFVFMSQNVNKEGAELENYNILRTKQHFLTK